MSDHVAAIDACADRTKQTMIPTAIFNPIGARPMFPLLGLADEDSNGTADYPNCTLNQIQCKNHASFHRSETNIKS